MRFAVFSALALALAAREARSGDAAERLAQRLEAFRTPGAVSLDVRLDLRLEHTLHKSTAKGEESLSVGVAQDAGGLTVRWESDLLRRAAEESQERDRMPAQLTPVREALKELDPARLEHLLDQVHTLASLTRTATLEEHHERWEGQEALRLVYRFKPRLSWTEAYYAHTREGRLTLWIAADGTPLASESVASFEGKTSRMFGRFKGTTTVRTRYLADGGRLRVAEREVDDLRSHEDGGEVDHVWQRFVLAPK
jgi:hypothetical protein